MEILDGLVYVICHPLTDEVVYVGQTYNFQARISHHLSINKSNPEIKLWADALVGQGLKPKFVPILTNLARTELHSKEQFWIYRALLLGAKLKNKTTITDKLKARFADNKGVTLQDILNYMNKAA